MEPWLRGTIPHSNPVVRALFHSFEQVREDLAKWTAGLTDEQVWSRPHGLTSLGFQLMHIAGSVDRLTTYGEGQSLTAVQLEFLRSEMTSQRSLDDLLHLVDESLKRAEAWAGTLRNFDEARSIGRQYLPTTTGGLIVHIAEHTQRHLGQAILTCKLLT